MSNKRGLLNKLWNSYTTEHCEEMKKNETDLYLSI